MGEGEKAPLRLQFNPKVRVAFVVGAVFAAAGALVISYLYFYYAGARLFGLTTGAVNVILLVPMLSPFAGGLLLSVLRRQEEGNFLFGAGAGALGAGLTTLAVPFFVISFISTEPDLNWPVLVSIGPVVLGVAAVAALLGALLTGSGAWLAGRVKGKTAPNEQAPRS